MTLITSKVVTAAFSAGSSWVGEAAPGDGDGFVIAAGAVITMDVDQTAFTGMASSQVQGSNTTPGTLLFAGGTGGHLKMADSSTLSGTEGTNRGRIVAGSLETPLPFAVKAIITLGDGASITGANLDIQEFPTEPILTHLRTYGTIQACTVDPGTDVFTTEAAHGLSNGDAVRFHPASGAVLPVPLKENWTYWAASVTEKTFKLNTHKTVGRVVDITSAGTGTTSVYTGAASGVGLGTPINVLDDVSTDDAWSIADGYNHAVLVNEGPVARHIQRVQITAKAAGPPATITLSANTDQVYSPGAMLILASRNCKIRSNTTATTAPVINGGTGFRLGALRGTNADEFGYAFSGGENHTASVVTGFQRGLHSCIGCTITTVAGNYLGLYACIGCTITTVAGHYYGLLTCIGCSITTVAGNYYGLNSCIGCSITTVAGNYYGPYFCIGCTVTTVAGNYIGLYRSGGVMHGTVFDNGTDIYLDGGTVTIHGGALDGSVQVDRYLYNASSFPILGGFQNVTVYDPQDSDGVPQPGRVLSWCGGGNTASADYAVGTHGTPPYTSTFIHETTLAVDESPTFTDLPVFAAKDQRLRIVAYANRQNFTGDEFPRFQLIDPNEPWDSEDSIIEEQELADDAGWQTFTFDYAGVYDRELIFRFRGTGVGLVYWFSRVVPNAVQLAFKGGSE